MQCYDDPVEDKRKGCASHEQCVKYSCSGGMFGNKSILKIYLRVYAQ